MIWLIRECFLFLGPVGAPPLFKCGGELIWVDMLTVYLNVSLFWWISLCFSILRCIELYFRETNGVDFKKWRDDAVAEAPPWNLRTRLASFNGPGDEPTTITGVKRGSNEGGGDGDLQKLKFSVSLLKEK